MKKLFISRDSIAGDIIRISDSGTIFYLSVVLRLGVGDHIYASDGYGRAYETNIIVMDSKQIELKILSERAQKEEASTRITLYQGLPKGGKMDEIVRKSTELGVSRIVPVLMERSIPNPEKEASAERHGRWARIAEEAARQSQRTSIPEVGELINMAEAEEGLVSGGFDLVLVLYELEERLTLKNVLRGKNFSNIAVFIGPEGGLEKNEVDQLISKGAISVTIGDTILRTETAGPAAIAMILYELEL